MKPKGKISKILLVLIIVPWFLTLGCEKEKHVDVEPQLEIVVLDNSENKVENAKVELYESENDWKNRVNELKEKQTDFQGSVLFERLKERKYYFFVSKDTLNNKKGIATHKEPLEKNEKRVIELTIK